MNEIYNFGQTGSQFLLQFNFRLEHVECEYGHKRNIRGRVSFFPAGLINKLR